MAQCPSTIAVGPASQTKLVEQCELDQGHGGDHQITLAVIVTEAAGTVASTTESFTQPRVV